MKNLFILIFILSSLFSQNTRYLDEVFDEIQKTEDVVYGNSPDLPFIFLFEWNTQNIDLDMDIYEPAGDTLSNRPAIIFLHSGAFFSGNNNADDMVDLSIQSAKRGYVSFNMNYRLGLNILSSYSGERAVYRGVQDLSAAIRFIRQYSNEYRIDPDKIYVWGSSAGSFIGLHLAFTEDDERPESTYGSFSDPDLGCIDCAGNNFVQNSKPNAVISCWGAIGDLEWIESDNNVPILMFHGDLDPIVPFDSGYPFTIDIALPFVYGSNQIFNKLQDLDMESYLYVGVDELHEYWGTLNGTWFDGPNSNYNNIKDASYNFLFNQIHINNPGDFDNDGFINVVDVIILINNILDNDSIQNFDFDLNGDLNINILDVVILVNIILG